ncbi:MAG TPA: Gfo/Idh/MocA family oxidoreductase [Chitinivibrionales bacterium]|jgi:predicted dehydrogenase|nr:Gfo/Idh/MocA family oxidoreductase [Chitinivibrionales bacterium]
MTKWGILGCGNIAGKFADALLAVPNAQLHAVASRSETKAREFGKKHHATKWHAGYGALAADPEVDAVYVATPHALHKAHTILCLNGGKPVLCEKPFAINRREAEEMVAVARTKKLFLMEAMWTRFLPVICKVRELLAGGIIGDVRMLTADFGFRAEVNPQARLFDPALGGGSLLDVGVYSVAMAFMIFNRGPSALASTASLGTTGVDEQAAAILRYDKGEMALLSSAIIARTANEANIFGTGGSIRIPSFWRAVTATVSAGDTREISIPFRANGYEYEAEEVMRCVAEGRLESDMMPLSESLDIMATMDAIRAQWGLVYPMEKPQGNL